jgi:hypothetical protein
MMAAQSRNRVKGGFIMSKGLCKLCIYNSIYNLNGDCSEYKEEGCCNEFVLYTKPGYVWTLEDIQLVEYHEKYADFK